MKGAIWILACVVLVGCESRPLDTQRLDSSGDDVSRELATAVRRALNAKTLEDNRLAQFGVEKQRLVSRLMPNGDFGDGHPLAIEGYVTERDPEAAKNLSVVLELEFMAAEAGPASQETPRFIHRKTERKKDLAERQGRKSQNRAKDPKQNPNSSEHPRQRV